MCIYIYIHICTHIYLSLTQPHPFSQTVAGYTPLVYMQLSPYTILPSPILYRIWHTKGGSVGGCILRNRRAIVLQ